MMPDREKVINGIKCLLSPTKCDLRNCPYGEVDKCIDAVLSDALALLKEQEEREQAICKEICDFIRSACSTDTDDDKDYVCYVIQNYFKHFCVDGERKDD